MQELDEIETVQLEQQAGSEPVSIDEATEKLELEAAAPNEPISSATISLDEVRLAALENNLELQVDLVEPAIALQTLEEERAAFEWIVFGSARYVRNEPNSGDASSLRLYETGVTVPLTTGGSITAATPLSVDGVPEAAISVTYIQSLLRGAGPYVNTYPIRLATYDKATVDALTKLTVINILAGADIAYWNLYLVRKELDVRREQFKLAQDQLQHARRKVESGSAPRIEIVRAQAGLASRLEDVINAETSVRDRQRDLKRIMNRGDMPLHSSVALIPATEPAPRGLDLDAEQLVAVAMDKRMELAHVEFSLAAADARLALARNALLPDLTFDYSYTVAGRAGSTGDAYDQLFEEPLQDQTFGLAAIVPLGNRAAQARLRRERLSRTQTEIEGLRIAQLIRQEVYDAADELEQGWRRILAAEQGVVAAYRDYKVEQSQFQLGQRTSTDVLLAASRLADAQLRRIRAFAGYEVAQVNLARATGTLLGRNPIPLTTTSLP